MWLLAPTRHGAHNWEGVGSRTALDAVDALASLVAAYRGTHVVEAEVDSMTPSAAHADVKAPHWCTAWRDEARCLPRVDTNRILLAGHSMGGHGAMSVAITISDRYL